MNEAFSRLGKAFWRLVPANPILVRVVHGGSRRSRHLWIRFAYLGVLMVVVLFAMTQISGSSTLVDLAKSASQMFMGASIAQLALMCFLAPMFTAGAITQERDAQTYNILLTTPLSNAQIVMGTLMSRLYFVIVLLLAGLPIFLITMIYGGVRMAQIMQSAAIAGSTAVITGSLAICISMIRVGTRKTIFSFYMMIAFYLFAVYALGQWPTTWIPEAPRGVNGNQLSWLASLHPFLALDVALNRVPAPDPVALVGRNGLQRYFLATPHKAYVFITLSISVLLIIISMFFVRRSKEGETTLWTRLFARGARKVGEEVRRQPRTVWQNPVAWREATSRASAATKGFLQIVLLGGGVVGAVALLVNHIRTGDVVATRSYLNAVVSVELAMILLVAANTAASALTKERESMSMDILLSTPLTSKYIVWGKLRGLVTFTVPLLAIPVVTTLLFAVHGLFVDPDKRVVQIETALLMGAMMFAYAAAACIWGLNRSLHCRKTVQAVMFAVGGMVVTGLILHFIADAIVTKAGNAGGFIAPFTPFTCISTMINPVRAFDTAADFKPFVNEIRVWFLVGAAASFVVWIGVVLGVYKNMVRGFDMTLRKQTAQVG